ncbi:cystathionine beta-lyase [Neokomagataea anthophila]|uniref:Cystathionine beta-lyase n=1 Tax=Neokomagataea anthophila TaxID=2826925 RepID=A0ABS5E6L0_9PROT|nr:cystathionine beta-lyase [Neokomagataea anthophila]MBR0559548.1 cystathionine beta-lyase [Neokomagataea anthophila]
MDHALEKSLTAGWHKMATTLVQGGRAAVEEGGTLVNLPVERGSTVLFPSIEAMNRQDGRSHAHKAVYGAMGNPTQHELEQFIAVLEGGSHTQIVNSGLSACTTPLLAFLGQGDHLLLPDSVYGPTRRFAETMLRRLGVQTSYYPPMASRDVVEGFLQSNTRIVFAESPGSHTFEVQDVPMLADVAHQAGALCFLDNTWGFGIFQPFEHGVDVSIQALSKYPSGHADVIMGSITVNDAAHWKVLRDASIQLGQCASPDDCWLVLRGLRTIGVRMAHQSQNAYALAVWLKTRSEVERVLHPAFEDCPGHDFWKRDFQGANGLFGVQLKADISVQAAETMLDGLRHFGIGASWGGYESLVLPTTGHIRRSAEAGPTAPTFRVHVGLESLEDLKIDLSRGLDSLAYHAAE